MAITGHSRNGKQSIIAAAFDERITAVVGSSPGTPISAPIRFSSPDFNGETVNFVSPSRDWWLPSVKEYFGRENEIPADGHMILALIAPRHAMLATARSDSEGDVTFAGEQNVLACRDVWALLGAPAALRVHYREGRHHGFVDPQVYFDWFDVAANAPGTASLFPQLDLPHAFDWAGWAENHPAAKPPPSTTPLPQRVAWLLGGESVDMAVAPGAVGGTVFGASYCESGPVGSEWDYKAALMMHDSFTSCSRKNCTRPMTRLSLAIGAYITASLFVPCADTSCKEIKAPLPVVIFLHGFAYQLGFTGIYGLYVVISSASALRSLLLRHRFSKHHALVYGRRTGRVLAFCSVTFLSVGGVSTDFTSRFDACRYSGSDTGLISGLVQGAGVAVLAFDMPGHGSRQTEGAANFYRRYPAGSMLGAMVGDVVSALDAIHCAHPGSSSLPECDDGAYHTGTYPALNVPPLDENRVILLGYVGQTRHWFLNCAHTETDERRARSLSLSAISFIRACSRHALR